MTDSDLHVVCPSCGAVNRLPAVRSRREAKCGKCHQPLFSGKPIPADGDSFERHISRNDIPVLVDFWAAWCGPCRTMEPALEQAATELEPEIRVLKLDTDHQPAVAERYGVRSLPTLMLFAAGRPIAHVAGAMTRQGISSWVRAHRPQPAPSPP